MKKMPVNEPEKERRERVYRTHVAIFINAAPLDVERCGKVVKELNDRFPWRDRMKFQLVETLVTGDALETGSRPTDVDYYWDAQEKAFCSFRDVHPLRQDQLPGFEFYVNTLCKRLAASGIPGLISVTAKMTFSKWTKEYKRS